MNDEIIWDVKTEKVREALREGKRLDGRKPEEYRHIEIKTGVSENADGSATVTLGGCKVIAGVKFVPGLPYPDSPDEGTISVGIELLQLASPSFESGPPGAEAIELSRVVDRGIRESKCIDFKDLCIREKELVWIVFIDLYALNDDGNLYDAASIAALAALENARIPKLKDDKIVKGEYDGKLKLARKPLLSTFAKIGGTVVADPDLAEWHALDARFSVATTEDGYLPAFQKGGGHGAFSKQEIDSIIDIALKNSKEIRKKHFR